MEPVPPALPGTVARILGTTDLGGTFVPVPTSYGMSGTCAGVAELLAREAEAQPTFWLDAGDLAVGPLHPLLGRRPWAELAELPIAAAAAGNHEFDDGVDALREAARLLPFPVLCANVDAGLPGSTVLDSPAGPVGVIGLTHPATHLYAPAPPPEADWPERVGPLARELRAAGARWVVVLLHDGVDWWPADPVAARPDRLAASVAPWVADVDLVIGGHTSAGWAGRLGGTPAGHAAIFGGSVLVVDLVPQPVVRGLFPVPPVRPARPTPATVALDHAAAEVAGESRHTWVGRTGARHYLPDLVARALREATGAPAGFVPAAQHTTQGALDGAVAALSAGPVTQLDLLRLFGYLDDRVVVVPLRPGEYRAIVAAHDAMTDPRYRAGDEAWWNWCRMPAGVHSGTDDPEAMAVIPFVVRRISELLGRDLDSERSTVGARDAVRAALGADWAA